MGLLGRAHVGFRHDFHQGDAGTIEVDVAIVGVLIVDGFAGVLLQMQALDTDDFGFAVRFDLDLAFADNWLLELADLVALRQVGVEVVLAVENRAVVDLRLEAETRANGLGDALFVDDGEHSRHRRIHQRNVAVGRSAERGRGARKQLGL